MGREVQEVAKPTPATPLKMEDAFLIFHLLKMILHIFKCKNENLLSKQVWFLTRMLH
jgi:hypothetical protein